MLLLFAVIFSLLDSYNEDSPVYISSHLLESQFSATSPLTGWMPPSLGIRFVIQCIIIHIWKNVKDP